LAPIESDRRDGAHMPLAIRISGRGKVPAPSVGGELLDVTDVHVLVVTAELAASFGHVQKIAREKHSSRVLETATYKALACR